LDDILDIDYVLECLSKITASDLHSTKHFELKVHLRKRDLISDVDSIRSIILKDKPVGILKQNETKFKLLYKLNDTYDLTIIISSHALIPISFNLVTIFIEEATKRLRVE
jgi:ABC-type lipoprotein export system ATPase subunit